MTGDEIISQFEWLVDDETIDEDQELVLLNLAYDRLNTMRVWNYLATSEESQTIAAGTTAYSEPSDMLYPTAVKYYDSSGDGYYRLNLVPYSQKARHWNVSTYVYYDAKNSNFVFTKDPSGAEYAGKTLVIEYQYQPTQLTTATSPVFNRAFHPLLAYEMARHYFYNDQGEKSRAWNKELDSEYNRMLSEMIRWDDMIDTTLEPTAEPDYNWTGGLESSAYSDGSMYTEPNRFI